MKKYYKSAKHKKYNKKHSRKQQEKAHIFKLYTKRKNALSNYNQYKRHSNKDKEYNKIKWNILTAPINFSLVENTEETIKFFEFIDELYTKRKPVFIHLQDIENLGHETIVVLLATMIKFKNNKIEFNGDYPNDSIARKRLISSSFFKVLYKNENNASFNIKNIKGNGIYTHINKKVDAELGSKLIEQATSTIWNEKRVCTGVQRTLIELMTNTNNHAGEIQGEKKWWVSISCLEKEKRAVFSFVDFGKGIFKSLSEVKGSAFNWGNWYNAVLGNNNNAEILKMILSGEMHRTVTGQSHRGKGLPGIYQGSQLNSLSKLYIISNDVFADIGNNKYTNMNINFNGTFICWEVNSQNKSMTIED